MSIMFKLEQALQCLRGRLGDTKGSEDKGSGRLRGEKPPLVVCRRFLQARIEADIVG